MTKAPPATTEAERRTARLAEALRANLARRKARARASDAAPDLAVAGENSGSDT